MPHISLPGVWWDIVLQLWLPFSRSEGSCYSLTFPGTIFFYQQKRIKNLILTRRRGLEKVNLRKLSTLAKLASKSTSCYTFGVYIWRPQKTTAWTACQTLRFRHQLWNNPQGERLQVISPPWDSVSFSVKWEYLDFVILLPAQTSCDYIPWTHPGEPLILTIFPTDVFPWETSPYEHSQQAMSVSEWVATQPQWSSSCQEKYEIRQNLREV